MTIHIAGGAPSTGSSLLRSMINAHSRFISGPETYLFAHPRLYSHWSRDKHLLMVKGFGGLKNETPFRLNGAILDKPWYGWNMDALRLAVTKSSSFPQFCEAYFSPALQREGGTHVVEKSPVNAYCFRQFLAHFPEGRVIHCIRDPYDATASMLGRGHGIVSAVSSYFFQAAFGLAAGGHERYSEIRYEQLVHDPGPNLRSLMADLKEPFESGMIADRHEPDAEATRLPGWSYDETQAPATGSIGRFDRLDEQTRVRLIQTFHSLRFKPEWVRRHQLPVTGMRQLCEAWGYPWRELEHYDKAFSPRLEQWKIQIQRAIRLYPNSIANYPFILDQ